MYKHFLILRIPNIIYKDEIALRPFDLKRYISATDPNGNYKWNNNYVGNSEDDQGNRLFNLRKRDWFIDIKELFDLGFINRSEYFDIYNKDIVFNPKNITVASLTDIIRNENATTRRKELRNQAISSGVHTIGASGDYSDLASFEADIEATQTGNLSGEHLDEETTITGNIVFDHDPSTFDLTITAQSGAEHDGSAYGNGARISIGSFDQIRLNFSNGSGLLQISKLAFTVAGSGTEVIQIDSTSSSHTVIINRNLIEGDEGNVTTQGIRINNGAAGTVRVSNNIIYDVSSGNTSPDIAGISLNAEFGLGYTWDIYNNTVINCGHNLSENSDSPNGTLTATNNLLQAGVTADFINANSAFSSTARNITEDASGPDAAYDNTDVNTNSVFKDFAGNDFRLNSAGDVTNLAIVDDGDDLSGIFTDDIQGQTRSTWYIGASEIVATGLDPSLEFKRVIDRNTNVLLRL